jgi:hypothetical protein
MSNIIDMNIYAETERISALYDLYIKGSNSSLRDKSYSRLTLTERALIQKSKDAHVTLIDIFSKYFSSSFAYTLKNKKNYNWYENNKDDINSDITLWLISQIDTYKVGEGNLSSFLISRSKWLLSDVTFRYSQDGSQMDHTWYQIRALSYNFMESHQNKYHRKPNLNEISQYLLNYFYEQKAETLSNNNKFLGADKDKLQKAVNERLSKDGILSAIKSLPSILSMGPSDIRLDSTIADSEGAETYLHESIASKDNLEYDVINDALDSLLSIISGDCDELAAPLLSNYGLIEDLLGTAVAPEFERKDKKKEKKELSYAKISKISKIDKSVIKDILKSSKFRVYSPVAQYAYLSN